MFLRIASCAHDDYKVFVGLTRKINCKRIGDSKLSETFLAERKRYNDQWKRVAQICRKNRDRYRNKTDVLKEALDLLEARLNANQS